MMFIKKNYRGFINVSFLSVYIAYMCILFVIFKKINNLNMTSVDVKLCF